MIKSITVTNHLDESITIDLAAPEKSGFAVLSIDGLGPPKAEINSTELSTTDGSVYNSARATSRNVVISFKFLWNPTIEYVRQLSYRYFPVKKQVRLVIETDARISEVVGYVESNEPNIFSDSEGTQISIICPDAYIRSAFPAVVTLNSIIPMFEFPVSNESDTLALLEFGIIDDDTSKTIAYAGDSDTGILLDIKATGTVTNLSVYNATTREMITIDTAKLLALTGSVIIFGDNILISTIKGRKYAVLIRNGVRINIISVITSPIQWIRLIPGDNVLAHVASVGETFVSIDILYGIIYEGV